MFLQLPNRRSFETDDRGPKRHRETQRLSDGAASGRVSLAQGTAALGALPPSRGTDESPRVAHLARSANGSLRFHTELLDSLPRGDGVGYCDICVGTSGQTGGLEKDKDELDTLVVKSLTDRVALVVVTRAGKGEKLGFEIGEPAERTA